MAPVLVSSWDGPNDADNPKNWPIRRKLVATALVSLFTFVNPLASSMLAPALPQIAVDLHVDESSVKTNLMLSAFVLGYLIGPLFWAPLSEMYGRVAALNIGNLLFLAFNLACGFVQTFPQMVVLRFFAGLGGISSLSSGSGLISDCWVAEQRARVWAFYILMPLLGPSFGPIVGGFIAENTTWRWMFWSTSIFDGAVQIVAVFLLRETYAPVILRNRDTARQKRACTSEPERQVTDTLKASAKQLSHALRRPIVLFVTQPILQAMSAYSAFLYGTLYLVLTTFPVVWTRFYGESIGIAGLNYISISIGFALGEFVTASVQDVYYRSRVKKSPDKKGQPEFRLPILIPEAILLPVGLLWYGWSVQGRQHWIMPNIGIAITAGSIVGSSQIVMLYVVDKFEAFTASAVSSLLILRFVAGFAFPLFALDMYDALGWGWGNSVLALAAVVLGIPISILLLFYGGRFKVRNGGGGDDGFA